MGEGMGSMSKGKNSTIMYFDCVSGISGDMVLGALIDLGVTVEFIKSELDKLGISSYELIPNQKQVSGISGISLDVILEDEPKAHTSHKEIVELIEESGISERAKQISKNIFKKIADAEATVHDKNSGDVHFHEVGALDSIIDVVGTAICIDKLGAKMYYCSTLHDGSGTIECRHGEIPVPVPAVMEMLKESDIKIKGTDSTTEMVTPTGLGILAGLDATCGAIPEMKVLDVGYGFGKRDTGRFNGLRIIMGERTVESEE